MKSYPKKTTQKRRVLYTGIGYLYELLRGDGDRVCTHLNELLRGDGDALHSLSR